MLFFTALRKKTWTSLITLVLVLQVINISIDAIDPSPYSEDLTINEIESCVELILEIALGHEGAIDETNDQDHSSHKPGNRVILFSDGCFVSGIECSFEILPQNHFLPGVSPLVCRHQPIHSPPPKA